jgi:hypothetical protein
LNLPIDQKPINITGEITYATEKNNDVDKLVADALDKDLDVFQRVEDLKARDKAFEMAGKYYIKGDSEYDQAEFDIQNANAKIIEAKTSLEVNIRNKYNDLLSAEESVVLADKYLALAGKKLDISITKLKNGMIDTLSNLNEKLNYIDAQYKRLSAVASYNTVKVDFEDMLQ